MGWDVPCFICGRNTESIDGFPPIEEEKCEELVEVPPAVLLLWPFARLLLLESRKALSSENCTSSRKQLPSIELILILGW